LKGVKNVLFFLTFVPVLNKWQSLLKPIVMLGHYMQKTQLRSPSSIRITHKIDKADMVSALAFLFIWN
jgi:hypothetical protein